MSEIWMYMCIDLHWRIAGDMLLMLLNIQYMKSSSAYPRSLYLTGQKTSTWSIIKCCIFKPSGNKQESFVVAKPSNNIKSINLTDPESYIWLNLFSTQSFIYSKSLFFLSSLLYLMVAKIREASGVIKQCRRKGTEHYEPKKCLEMRDLFSSVPPKQRTGHSGHQSPTRRPLCFHATVYSEVCCLLYLLMGISAFSLEGNSRDGVQSHNILYGLFTLLEV